MERNFPCDLSETDDREAAELFLKWTARKLASMTSSEGLSVARQRQSRSRLTAAPKRYVARIHDEEKGRTECIGIF